MCTGISNNILKKAFASLSMSVTIQLDYSYYVEIGDNCLTDCLSFTTEKINSLRSLESVLEVIDSSSICAGNPDKKFNSAQQDRKESSWTNQVHHISYLVLLYYTLNHYMYIGTTVVAFYDSRLLPQATIRHSDCPIFILKDAFCCRSCEE